MTISMPHWRELLPKYQCGQQTYK